MNRGTFGAGASASYHSDRLLTGESCHSTCHGETDLHGILTVPAGKGVENLLN